MTDDKNFLQKIDELFYTKVPYQVYIVAALFCLVAVATLVSDYISQEPPLNLTIDMSSITSPTYRIIPTETSFEVIEMEPSVIKNFSYNK